MSDPMGGVGRGLIGPPIVIQSPEGVTLELELAGAARRLLAWLVDMVVIMALLGAMGLVVARLAPLAGGVAAALGVALYAAISWGYFVVMEWRAGGQSLGKRALGIRVMGRGGAPVTLAQSAVRNLLRVLDGLPLIYLVGGAAILSSHDQGRVGDWVAGTIVVRERPPSAVVALIPEGLRGVHLPVDRGQLVAELPAAERALLLELATRRERLPLEVRLRLFSQAAEYFRGRLGIDASARVGDEALCLHLALLLAQGVGGAEAGEGAPERQV
ncbi:MAG: hypothetical protein CMH57_08395 [Myxococcales bacterium]|nr:hypothetical protein [Myxococcales bacterium]